MEKRENERLGIAKLKYLNFFKKSVDKIESLCYNMQVEKINQKIWRNTSNGKQEFC